MLGCFFLRTLGGHESLQELLVGLLFPLIIFFKLFLFFTLPLIFQVDLILLVLLVLGLGRVL